VDFIRVGVIAGSDGILPGLQLAQQGDEVVCGKTRNGIGADNVDDFTTMEVISKARPVFLLEQFGEFR